MAIVKLFGVRMTTEERNMQMKMEYVTSSVTVEEMAEKYKLSTESVKSIRRKEGWVKARKNFNEDKKEAIDDTLKQVYAGFKVEINVKYNTAWQKLMNIVNVCLDEPDKYLMHKNGMPRWGALDVVASLLERAQRGQGEANGVLPEEVRLKLEIQRDKLLIAREMAGMGDATEIVTDNLLDVLSQAAENVWAGEVAPPIPEQEEELKFEQH